MHVCTPYAHMPALCSNALVACCLTAALTHMQAVRFYKAWDAYGALSNFSCHAVTLPEGPLTDANAPQEAAGPLEHREWPSVEHYYQAQKFATTRGELLHCGPTMLPSAYDVIHRPPTH